MDRSCQTRGASSATSSAAPTKAWGNHAAALKGSAHVGASCPKTTDALDLPDGTRLELRPIGPEDRDGYAALVVALTPESRRSRFLSAKAELTSRELAYFTDIDHVHHEAFAAIDKRDGSIRGVGHYAHDARRPRVAEVAVEVADELHSMGIGSALARCMVQRARVNGFTALTAMTLRENRPARALLRRLGFQVRTSHGDTIEHELKLDPVVSQDVVQAIRDWYAHYNRGDGEPSLDFWHKDAEYRTAPEDPDAATHRGIDEIARLFASWREAYPDLRVVVHEAKASSDRAFAWVRLVGRGAASGIPVDMELAHVYTMFEGKAARLVEYTDRTDALHALWPAEAALFNAPGG
jgi:ketosteroid isomerase-like protein/GNAT superfamily N-acetyltransferase